MTDQSLIRTGIIRTGITRTGIMGPTLQPGPGVPGWNGLGQALAALFPSAIWINFKHKCSIIITPDTLSVWNTSRPLFQMAGDVHVHWNANCSAWPTPHTQPRQPSVKKIHDPEPGLEFFAAVNTAVMSCGWMRLSLLKTLSDVRRLVRAGNELCHWAPEAKVVI